MAAPAGLAKWLEKMDKTFGAGKFSKPAVVPYVVIPTGSIVLDYKLSVGGYVQGRTHEIWGAEQAGKTTLALIAIAQAQKMYPDKQAVFIDMEHRLDFPWAIAHGVAIDRLMVVKPSNAEEVADMLKYVCRSGFFSIVVLDSVGAMITLEEIDKDAEKSAMGSKAQVITRMIQVATVEADASDTTVILLNQVRANFGYGADTTTGGGFALKHATTTRLKVKRVGGTDSTYKAKIDGEDRIVGYQIAVDIQRNSVAPSPRTAVFPLFVVATEKYGPVGIDSADEAFTMGLQAGLILQTGGWYTVTSTGERLNGREAVIDALREQPTVVADLRVRALATVADEVKYPDENGLMQPPKSTKGKVRRGEQQ